MWLPEATCCYLVLLVSAGNHGVVCSNHASRQVCVRCFSMRAWFGRMGRRALQQRLYTIITTRVFFLDAVLRTSHAAHRGHDMLSSIAAAQLSERQVAPGQLL
jgi:hypothetical protein